MTTIANGLEFLKTYRVASYSIVQLNGTLEMNLKVEGGWCPVSFSNRAVRALKSPPKQSLPAFES